ncbi:MAG TPA: hypothetical protein VLT89_07615 [Usitatibacter sp.]|nr:hypothetical protein [Usitatibacter sp.]
MMRFENRHQQLAPPEVFRSRLIRSGTVGLVLVAVSLLAGMLGYEYFEDLDLLDAFVNAAMILSGMGPVNTPHTAGGKLFAGLYALYSGFAVLVIAAVIFAPAIHRALHRFHIEDSGGEEQDRPERKVRKARPRAR